MIETEQQRRWWFATHPQYSWGSSGSRNPKQEPDNGGAAKGEAESLGDRLSRFFIERSPNGGAFMPRVSKLPTYEELSRWPQELKLKFLRSLNSLYQNNPFAIDPNHLSASHALSPELIERMAQPGPGKWVLVPRSPLGLEHQSKMSGFPVIEIDGKQHIHEYEVMNPVTGDPVRFDDYRDGILYEYKKRQGNLINRTTGEFDPWCRQIEEARDRAEKHLQAAQGIPVVWRVGADQVHAYKKAIGDRRGLSIVP